MKSVATSLSGLTPEWLTECLSARYPGIRVGAAQIAPLDIGPSYHGNLARIELHGVSGAAAPTTLVAKLVADSPAARDLGVGMGIYLREALFYEQLAPSVRLRPPICHGAAYDPETGLSTLLLEDMTDLEVGVQAAGYTPARARATVLQLADQHAAFWNDDTLAGHAWLPIWNQPEMVAYIKASFPRAWPYCRSLYETQLTPQDAALGDGLGNALATLMEAIGTPPVTLLHGDARYDNLLYDAADPSVPPRTVDWQFVARGRGPQDLAYFLTQSADAEVAATNERDLVGAYHERLLENGIAGYPAEACWDDYRRCTLYSLVYPIFTAAMVDPADAGQVEAVALALRRGFNAANRLDSAGLLQA